MAEPSRVAAVVVTYDALPWIEQCLDSLRGVETVVVDNGSSDGTVAFVRERFPEVKVVEAENRGLGAGWNIGVRETSSTYVLLLNADAWLLDGALERLCDFADTRPRAAVVGPRLLNPDGTLQRSVRGYPTLWRLATEYLFLRKLAPGSSALNAFYAGGFDHDEVREVEVVMGACMLLRRDAIDAGRRRATRTTSSSARRRTGATGSARPAGRSSSSPAPSACMCAARRTAVASTARTSVAICSSSGSTAARRRPSARAACSSRRCVFAGSSSAASAGVRIATAPRGSRPVTRPRCSGADGRPLRQARVRHRGRPRARVAARANAGCAQRVGEPRVVARRRVRGACDHLRARLDPDADARAARSRRRRRGACSAASGAGPPPRRFLGVPGCSSGVRSSACSCGSRHRRCKVTVSSTSPVRGSCSSSTTCRSSAFPSSPTAACTPGTRSRSGTGSSR